MKPQLFIYALIIALGAVLIEWLQMGAFMHTLPTESYVVGIAIVFLALGGWAGGKWFSSKQHHSSAGVNERAIEQTGLSGRELEVLMLIADGLSNQEIADKLHVSTNTIKTHISSIFFKLDVKRRTQAIQVAKRRQIIA